MFCFPTTHCSLNLFQSPSPDLITLNLSRGNVWIPWERQGGGGESTPLPLIPHLNGQMAPMSDFLSSGHLKRFLGIGFDNFFICSPPKMTPCSTWNKPWHEGIWQIGKKAKNEFFGPRAPIWGRSSIDLIEREIFGFHDLFVRWHLEGSRGQNVIFGNPKNGRWQKIDPP